MSQNLTLDKRQRAMLREMGVRVWQPLAPVPAAIAAAPAMLGLQVPGSSSTSALAPPEIAIDSIATSARISSPTVTLEPQRLSAQPTLPPPAEVRSDSNSVSWSVGNALALYAQATPAPGPRWLVLAETPSASLPSDTAGSASIFNPFAGDAGKLLDNMLRAVRLHNTGSVMLAPLGRRVGVDSAPDAGFSAALATLVQAVQPDVVLVMGRLAAQALLQSSEPFGKLRGQVHTLHGVHTIVTHDAAYLLRSPLEKAKAWEDLCLALSVT
jgi:uracil-DNA glycosylase family 4